MRVHRVAVARVIVPGHQDDPLSLLGIFSSQHRVHIGDRCRLRNPRMRPRLRWLGKRIALHLQAAAAVARVALQALRDPIGSGSHALARRKVCIHAGNRASVLETHQAFDSAADLLNRDLVQHRGDSGINGCRLNWRTCCIQIVLCCVRHSRCRELVAKSRKPAKQTGKMRIARRASRRLNLVRTFAFIPQLHRRTRIDCETVN